MKILGGIVLGLYAMAFVSGVLEAVIMLVKATTRKGQMT